MTMEEMTREKRLALLKEYDDIPMLEVYDDIPIHRKARKRGKKKKGEKLDPKNAFEAMIIEKRNKDLLNLMKACPEPRKKER